MKNVQVQMQLDIANHNQCWSAPAISSPHSSILPFFHYSHHFHYSSLFTPLFHGIRIVVPLTLPLFVHPTCSPIPFIRLYLHYLSAPLIRLYLHLFVHPTYSSLPPFIRPPHLFGHPTPLFVLPVFHLFVSTVTTLPLGRLYRYHSSTCS